jgi:hypothetical protein
MSTGLRPLVALVVRERLLWSGTINAMGLQPSIRGRNKNMIA